MSRSTHIQGLFGRRAILFLSLFALSLFFGLFLQHNFAAIVAGCLRNLDRELIQLSVFQAKTGEAFTGAYSRFSFRHPGPSFFYYLAIFQNVLPEHIHFHAASRLAALTFNYLTLFASLLVAARVLREKFHAPLFLLCFLAAVYDRKQFLLLDYWNPNQLPTLFLLFLLSSIGFSRGNPKFFVPLSLSAHFLMQLHVGTIPSVLFLGVLSTLSFLLELRKQRQWNWNAIKNGYILFGLLLTILFWYLPLFEALQYEGGGNFGALFRFFFTERDSKPLIDAFAFVCSLFSGPQPLLGGLGGKYIFGLCLVLCLLCYRGLDRSEREILATCILLTLVTVGSASKVSGEFRQYLIYYYLAVVSCIFYVSVSALLSLGKSMFFSSSKWTGSIWQISSSLVCLAILILIYPEPVKVLNCKRGDAIARYISELEASTDHVYEVEMTEPAPYSFVSRFALDMSRLNHRICFPDDWAYRFGRAMTCSYLRRKNPGQTSFRRVVFSKPGNQKSNFEMTYQEGPVVMQWSTGQH